MPHVPAPVPSSMLLQALQSILRPSIIPYHQSRTIAQSAFRKPKNITRLDKLHRRQKQADRQEVIDSYLRAQSTNPVSPPSPPAPQDQEQNHEEAQLEQSQLPYHIHRTRSSSLPIYHDSKRGGNMHLTLIRKTSGDLNQMRDDLSKYLGLGKVMVKGRKVEGVRVNWNTRQIVVRGWRGPEVRGWAARIGF